MCGVSTRPYSVFKWMGAASGDMDGRAYTDALRLTVNKMLHHNPARQWDTIGESDPQLSLCVCPP